MRRWPGGERYGTGTQPSQKDTGHLRCDPAPPARGKHDGGCRLERTVVVPEAGTLQIRLRPSDSGDPIVLRESLPVTAGEVVDATFMSAAALDEFLTRQVAAAKDEDLLLSVHLKATMMKVSDPIIFGHAVRAALPGDDAPGVRVETLVLDVRSREDVESKVPAAIEAFGGVDVLVNNAGLAQGLDPFQDSTVDDAVTMIDTNVKGLLYVTKAVLPYMIDKNAGHIVNMGSTAGIYAYPGGAVYCATKAAVKMLSDGIRMDTIATDIKVTTIQPGIVETPFSEVRFHGDAERAKAVYAGIDAIQPEDVADVVLYVTNQPKRLQISDVTIMANQQAAGFMVHKK